MIENNRYKCPYCNKIFTKFGICNHIICKHTESGIQRVKTNSKMLSKKLKGCKSWNKGLTKETHPSLKKASETHKKNNYVPWNKGKKNCYSKETLENISTSMKRVAKERVSCHGVGKAYQGWYKDYWCDSQWELAFVIYCLDHNIEIKRCNEGFKYSYNNEIHFYYPDFIVNNEYIEIKGYQNEKDLCKFNSFPKDKILKVYRYNDLKPIFSYIFDNYNIKNMNNIHILYTNPYKIKFKDKKEKVDINKLRIERIKEYNIDFTKLGWVEKIANLENISHTQVTRFMKKFMPDFYEKCYVRKPMRPSFNG